MTATFCRALVRAMTAFALLVAAPPLAHAQLPTIGFTGGEVTVFEGDPSSPAVTLTFPIALSAVSTQAVTALFSTFTFSNNAVTGASCTGSVDFIGITNQLVTIPANANPPTTSVSVTVCRDDVVEFHQNFANQFQEDIGVVLTNPSNATCAGCANVGNINDDDGNPSASINNVSVREPSSGSRTATFTVTLSHPHPGFEVRVGYATRNGTARSVTPGACNILGTNGYTDYFTTSGTLIFASGVTSRDFNVTVCADPLTNESTEEYFVDLSPVLNVGAGADIGVGTIVNAVTPSFGTFTLDPVGADIAVDEWATYTFGWTVSVGVWRDLQSMDIRFRQQGTNNVPLWIRWVEADNTFQICSGNNSADSAAAKSEQSRCGDAVVAGTPVILETARGAIDVSKAKVTGSGPTGKNVVLEIPVQLLQGAGHRTYDVEISVAGDAGDGDDFFPAAVLRVD